MKTARTLLAAAALLTLSAAPTAAQTSYRINALVNLKYESGEYKRVNDSLHFYFSGSHFLEELNFENNSLDRSYPEYILKLYRSEIRIPTFPHERPMLRYTSDSIVYYSIDAGSGLYENRSSIISATQDANGDVVEIITRSKVGASWVNISRDNYSYNANHQIVNVVEQKWESGAWANKTKKVANYNADGQIIEMSFYNWTAGNWKPDYSNVYQYDGAGNCTTTIVREDNSGTWKNSYRYTISYNSDNQTTQILQQNWLSGSWKDYYKLNVTYNSNGDKTLVTTYNRLGSAWEPDEKETHSYSGTQNLGYTQQEYDGSVWNNTKKCIYQYNADGLLEYQISQTWDIAGSEWINGSRCILEYNSLDLASSFVQEFWNPGEYWSPTSGNPKYLFYYEEYATTGLSHIDIQADLNIYPNPTSQLLNVAIDWKNPTNSILTIYDLSGRACYSQNLGKENQTRMQIDLSNFATGSYFLNVKTNETQTTKAFQVLR